MEMPQTEADWQNLMVRWLNRVDLMTNELLDLTAQAAPDSIEAGIGATAKSLRDKIDLDSVLDCATPALMAQWYAAHWALGSIPDQAILSQVLMTGRSPIRSIVAQFQLLTLYEAPTPEHHTALAASTNALYELWRTHVLLAVPEFFASHY